MFFKCCIEFKKLRDLKFVVWIKSKKKIYILIFQVFGATNGL